MNNRRSFFKQLACGLLAVSAPTIFIPKLIETPKWRTNQWIVNPAYVNAEYDIDMYVQLPYYIARCEIQHRQKEYKVWEELFSDLTILPNV